MNGPIQVPMPGAAIPALMKQDGKGTYSLSEFGELIEPVYRVYREQIRRCISGLTGYAAQCAAAQRGEQIPKLREHIVMMGGFWAWRKMPLSTLMKLRGGTMAAGLTRP